MSTIFVLTTKTTQHCPQNFLVNGSIICNFAALLTSSVQYGIQWLVMVNSAWDFSKSEMVKYFE